MTMFVKADSNFNGTFIEEVPADFEITGSGNFNVEKVGGSKFISWQLNLKVGEKKELSYIYQAPKVSPQFYLLGPAKIYKSRGTVAKIFSIPNEFLFEESRQWQIASDADEGPNFAGTVVNDASIGTVSWSSPHFAAGDNNSDASATINNNATNYLKATNFGFSIPDEATITGIKVEWQRNSRFATATTIDNAIRIVKDGTIGSEDKSSATSWPSSLTYAEYGGEGDLWGETWTPDDINSSDFGTALSVQKTDSGDEQLSVRRVRITVYYSIPIDIHDDFDSYSNGNVSGNNGGTGEWSSAWANFLTGSAWQVQDSTVLQGTKSIASGSANETNGVERDFSDSETGIVSALMRRESNSSGTGFFALLDGTTLVARVQFNASGNITVRNNTTEDFVQAYSADTTYRITFDLDLPNDQYRIKIDQGSWTDWKTATGSKVNKIRFVKTGTTVQYVDDITSAEEEPVISTIGQATCGGEACDYSTVQAWWDNVRTSTNPAQWGEVYSGGAVGGWNQTSMDNATPTASEFPRLYAAPGHGHEGKIPGDLDTIAYVSGLVILRVDYTHIGRIPGESGEGLLIRRDNAYVMDLNQSNGDFFNIDGNLIVREAGATVFGQGGLIWQATGHSQTELNFRNNIMYASADEASSSGDAVLFRAQVNGMVWNIEHNTLVINFGAGGRNGMSISRASGVTSEGSIRNNTVFNAPNSDFSNAGPGSGVETRTHNAASDGTGTNISTTGGINNLDSNDQFIDPASDWNLKAAADLVEAGTFVIDYDALGVTRPQGSEVDIGALEFFDELVNISGKVYESDPLVWTGCDGTTQNISLAIDGEFIASTSCIEAEAGGEGEYEFEVPASLISSGDSVSVFINQTDKGAAVTLAEEGDIENFHVEKGNVLLSSVGSATALTNTHLAHCDDGVTGCENVPYSVTSGDLEVEPGNKLFIVSGRTYTPGGDVDAPAIRLAGTLNAGSNTFELRSAGTNTSCTSAVGTMMPLCING
jgi:hypothetical protein